MLSRQAVAAKRQVGVDGRFVRLQHTLVRVLDSSSGVDGSVRCCIAIARESPGLVLGPGNPGPCPTTLTTLTKPDPLTPDPSPLTPQVHLSVMLAEAQSSQAALQKLHAVTQSQLFEIQNQTEEQRWVPVSVLTGFV